MNVFAAMFHLFLSLSKSMIKWAKSGFKVVPYYTFWKRRLICSNCNDKLTYRCPTCGCFLWAICHLPIATCENWDKYLDKSKYEVDGKQTSIEPPFGE